MGYSTSAVATPVFMRKQSDRLAAQLNSPPLTWILHSVALRNGTMPGSRRLTSAPRDRKSSAPFGGIFKPYFILFSSQFKIFRRLILWTKISNDRGFSV